MSKSAAMETGQKYKWRTPSRAVAYFDLTMQIISFVAILAFASFFLATSPNSTLTSDGKLSGLRLLAIIGSVIVIAIILLIPYAIGYWLIEVLLAATKPDADPEDALRKAKLWRNMHIVFLILGLIGNVLQTNYVASAVSIITRGGFIFIVCKFIGELNEA